MLNNIIGFIDFLKLLYLVTSFSFVIYISLNWVISDVKSEAYRHRLASSARILGVALILSTMVFVASLAAVVILKINNCWGVVL